MNDLILLNSEIEWKKPDESAYDGVYDGGYRYTCGIDPYGEAFEITKRLRLPRRLKKLIKKNVTGKVNPFNLRFHLDAFKFSKYYACKVVK